MVRRLLPFLTLALTGAVPALGGPSFVGSGITIITSNQQVLGNSALTGFYPGYFNGIGIRNPYDWRYLLMYREDGSWYWIEPTYDGLPLIELVRREDPELVKAIIGPTMPEPDQAMVDLRAGRYAEAAAEFARRHAQQVREEADAEGIAVPDRSALRLEALALAGAGAWRDAATRFIEAHDQDPALGSDPIDGSRVLASSSEVRRIGLDAMRFAKRSETADAWALVGYLMQVQGRHDEARAMLVRAAALR